MNIGIIGAGNVGGTLGRRWQANGHTVTLANRQPDSIAAAARAGDILLLSTPWPATEEALRHCGGLTGKIVIDATNPLLPTLDGLTVGNTSSGGEQVAQWAAGAKVVKAFNSVGYNIMDDPKFETGEPTMFYCGDDADAKKTVSSLIAELGFTPVDAGPLSQARLLEPFALLWITLALKCGQGLNIAFELLHR